MLGNIFKLFFTIGFCVCSTVVSNSQSKIVLWDFRKDAGRIQNFSKAESQAVLKFVFGETWGKDLEINSRISGSFTKPNVTETLYYIGGCDEGEGFKSNNDCSHSGWWNSGKIAIYNATTPILKIENVALGYEIVKITDINNDGINEFFSISGFSNMGSNESSGSLGQIVNGKYKNIKSLIGYSDSCGVIKKSQQFAKAAVISYIPSLNGSPIFLEEYFQNRCGKTPWKKITKKQFDGIQ